MFVGILTRRASEAPACFVLRADSSLARRVGIAFDPPAASFHNTNTAAIERANYFLHDLDVVVLLMSRLSKLLLNVTQDGWILVNDAEFLLDHPRHADHYPVAHRVAIIDAMQKPLIRRQFVAIRGKDAIVATLLRTIAKHWRGRERINVAPQERHKDICRQQQQCCRDSSAGAKRRCHSSGIIIGEW